MELVKMKFNEFNRFNGRQLVTYDKDLITVTVYNLDNSIGDKEIIVDKETATMIQKLAKGQKITVTDKKITIKSDDGTYASELIAADASPNVDAMLDKQNTQNKLIEMDLDALVVASRSAEQKQDGTAFNGVIIDEKGNVYSTNRALIYGLSSDEKSSELISLPIQAIVAAKDNGLKKIALWASKDSASIISYEWKDGKPECQIITRLNGGAAPDLASIIEKANEFEKRAFMVDTQLLVDKIKFYNADIVRLEISDGTLKGQLDKFEFSIPCKMDKPEIVKVAFSTKLFLSFLAVAENGHIDLVKKNAIIYQNSKDDKSEFIMLTPMTVY